jgi:hypothetical protein
MKSYRSWKNSRNRLIEEGKLPPAHPGVKFLHGMNHCLRCLSRKEYALAYEALKGVNVKFCGCNLPEQNTRYAIMQNINGSVHELQKAVENVLEHHFGVHSSCGAWCPAIRWKDNPEKRKNLVYRDKAKDRILYEQLEATRAPFLTLDRLQEMMSKFNTQKNENTMKVITGTIPKTTFLGATQQYVGKDVPILQLATTAQGQWITSPGCT